MYYCQYETLPEGKTLKKIIISLVQILCRVFPGTSHCRSMKLSAISLQNRWDLLAHLRRTKESARRTRSASHARGERCKKKMLCSWYICPLLARDSCLPSIAWKVHTNSPVLKATHLTSKVYPEANCRTTEIKLEWGLMKTISRCWFELCLYNVFCRSENDNESFSTQWECSWIEELCFSATFPWITNLTAIKYSNTYTLLESSILTPERKAEKTCCTKKL